jgi:hypothetical protein
MISRVDLLATQQFRQLTEAEELDFIYTETAHAVIEQRGWIAGPELFFALKAYVKQVESERRIISSLLTTE